MVTRRELVDCPFMEPYTDGSYQFTSEIGYAWRCDTCGLVWDRKHYAEYCGSRKHVAHWRRGYGATMVLNGVPNYKGFIDVDAIRRESLDAPCPSNDPHLVELRAQRAKQRADRKSEYCREGSEQRIDELLDEWELILWAEYNRR